jgi:twitching motility protein PilT
MSLKAVVSQQLLKKIGGGRVAACEIMVVDYAISNLIREAKTPQIRNALQTSAALGSITMEAAVNKLVREGKISQEVADKAAGSPSVDFAANNGKSSMMGMFDEPQITRPKI